jgi:hypothetical protein
MKAYVHKETTLGVIFRGDTMQPLAGKPSKGGKCGTDNPFYVDMKDVRPATQEDFDYFNVMSHPDYLQ